MRAHERSVRERWEVRWYALKEGRDTVFRRFYLSESKAQRYARSLLKKPTTLWTVMVTQQRLEGEQWVDVTPPGGWLVIQGEKA